MKVITIVQTKGGSGKTTTAMLLASAALDAGRCITLIDGDVNAQLGHWRDSFELAAWEPVKKPAWPAALSIRSPPETLDGLLAFSNRKKPEASTSLLSTRGPALILTPRISA